MTTEWEKPKEESCRFCEIFTYEEILFHTRCFFVIPDAYPVNRGHLLIISKRHLPDIFSVDHNEWEDLINAIDRARRYLKRQFTPDGYNIGVNCGEAAGQTIPHLHIHVIPRYKGDAENQRGGIRNFRRPMVEY